MTLSDNTNNINHCLSHSLSLVLNYVKESQHLDFLQTLFLTVYLFLQFKLLLYIFTIKIYFVME